MRETFADLDRWRSLVETMAHSELAQVVLDESGYTEMWQNDKSLDAPGRLENLKELVVAMDDSLLPNADPATMRGFVVSGFDSATGLHRCILSELPLQPVRSLGELQHLDLTNDKMAPPFASSRRWRIA